VLPMRNPRPVPVFRQVPPMRSPRPVPEQRFGSESGVFSIKVSLFTASIFEIRNYF
jgi:hypothetical protein